MKHKNKVGIISLFALLLVAIFGSEKAMAIELDTVWVSDINGQVLSQHSISKNIFISNNGITEIYHQDGKLVRIFPLSGSCIEFSPDGNKVLYCAPDGVRVFNITTLEDVLTITTKYWYPKFLGNDKIVFLSGLKNDTEIGIYDLLSKEIKLSPFSSNDFTALATSPNGKYIAYATYEQNNTIDSKAYLYLLDAETMEEIKELGSWENTEGHNINRIHFSSDSKFLTYTPTSFNSDFSINIYNLDNYKISKSITLFNFQFEISSVLLLDNNYYLIRGYNLFNETSEIRICSLKTHEVIYKTNDFSKYIQTAKFDSEKKHLFCNTPVDKTFCFDLNNIISGVSLINPINIRYSNKNLTINNNEKPINQISIMTIEGREVFKQNYERLTFNNNEIEIPLELSNGLYLINITSGNDHFVHKLLIKE